MGRSLKSNFILNFLNTVSVVLFPMLTFPYVSRILFADGMGLVNFQKSIIDYVGMFVCLGIPTYAVREIARVRDNTKERDKTTVEILLLNIILMLIGYTVIILLALNLNTLQNDLKLFLILSLSIMLMTVGCEWFYKGIEDFKYITIRGLTIKAISLIFLFSLVKTKEDILWYAVYNVFGVTGGNIFNIVRLKKYVDLGNVNFRTINIRKHLKPSINSFVLTLFFAIYITLNTMMLGFLCNNQSVGYFTASTKITQIALSVVNSLGIVLLPRLSNLVHLGKKEEFHQIAQKALHFIVAISLPMIAGCMLLSPYIINIFCGPSYNPAIINLILISPVILIIGLSSFIGIQILYPQGKERIVIICTLIGTAINIILNFYLIKKYAHNGAAISAVMGQLIILISLFLLGRNYHALRFSRAILVYMIATAFMVIIIYLSLGITNKYYVKIPLSIVFGGFAYCSVLVLFRDPIFLSINDLLFKIKSR
ncbi:oligosaccharide flippase family protein [Sphingobacterium multivorum]|uniref:oligosaccharide flippase family protein n=1 Tax=Sphingobacterium multivorum TaxID=28454 RepID=UPI0028ADA3B4|nr:oligosaccharide flippase family protein [Sphingobacterium multivorum]